MGHRQAAPERGAFTTMDVPLWSRRAHRHFAVLAACVVFALLTVASTAFGALSFYRTGTLDAAVTYSSVQRSDWYANAINNTSSTNMMGRVWSYNVVTQTYVMQLPDQLIYPNQAYGTAFTPQASVRNYCRKVNGGTQAGSCNGAY